MKNACKRLFSLMLALVLLVSVVPFQAMAAENDGVFWTAETPEGAAIGDGYGTYNEKENPSVQDVFNYVCDKLGIEDHDDCYGIFNDDWTQIDDTDKKAPAVLKFVFEAPETAGNPDEGDDGEDIENEPADITSVWWTAETPEGKAVGAGSGTYTGKTNPSVQDVFNAVCDELGIEDHDACYGIFDDSWVQVSNRDAAPSVLKFVFEAPKDENKDDNEDKEDKPTQYFVTFQYGNGEETTLTYDVNGNIVDGKAIPDAGENFKCWRDVETGKKFDPKEGPSKNMIVRAEYEKDDNNNNDNDEYADFIFYFETKRGTRVGEYKFTAQKDSYKDVSEATAQEYLNADQTLYSEFRGKKYEVTNVKGDEFKYDRQTGNYFCTVEVREVSNNGGNNGNHDEDFGKDNVRVTFLYDNTNKKVDYTFYQKNLNKGFELDDDDALWILKNKTRIDTDKYALPDEDDFEYYYSNGKMQITIELVEKNRNNVFVQFSYDHDVIGKISYKTNDPSDEEFSVKEAEKLMKEALSRDELERYQLMIERREPVVSRKNNHNGTYTYTIALERKYSERKLDITVYVRNDSKDDYKKVINDRTITVKSYETYEDDVFDWINRADRDDRHYSEYDYRIKDHDFDKDHENLKVYLEKRHHEDDDRKIYLQVYINGDKTSYAKKLTITNSRYITDDGELDIDEAIKIVREYFVPKNSEKDMNFDGLWLQGKDDVFDYDDEHDTINLKKYRDSHETATVVIMANNAKLKNNSSNPKTGDEILVAVTVMAVSATALAAAYILNKKRMAK